jgi:arabinosyltransferase
MTADKLKTHFELVNHQLLYIRAAIALAQLTGRVLILPPIWCELDKYWAPLHNGGCAHCTLCTCVHAMGA